MGTQVDALPLVEHFRVDLTSQEIASAQRADVRSVASQGYLYGLPSFLHMRQLTEFIAGRRYFAPDEPPIGGWILVRKLADPTTDNRYPNVDTLYGAVYLLLDQHGPVVITLPAISDRYFSVAFHDAYFNNFAIAGTSSAEIGGARILLVPHGWNGDTPADIDRVIEAPTPIVNLYQRIFVRDASEYDALHALQDAITLSPLGGGPFPILDLSAWDIPAMRATRDPLDMFGYASGYQALNGWPAEDNGLVALLATSGLGPLGDLPQDEAARSAIREGSAEAQSAISARLSAGPFKRGWNVPDPDAGAAGPHYLSRAAIQASQIGSLLPSEAMYFFAHLDVDGKALSGERAYTFTFAADALPQLKELGFWSLTMYGPDAFLVDNPLDRYIIRPDSDGLTYAEDGSLTIYLQAERPELAPEANWLPSPTGAFTVCFRTYRPTEAITSGEWFPPGIAFAAL